MADLFLSYRNTAVRRAYVERLRLCLDAYSISVWWDYGLEAGKAYEEQIIRELTAAAVVSPIWCEQSIGSEWVHREARHGLEQGKLIPARLENVKPPTEFEHIQCQDLVGWTGSAESFLITGYAGALCNRIGRPLSPQLDKLRALRSLKELPALGSEPAVSARTAYLQVHRVAQLSAGGSAFHLYWNRERLGELRMGNSAAFELPAEAGEFQVGMHHALKRSLHLTAPLPLQLVSGQVTRIKVKVGSNLWGFPPLLFWVNDASESQERGWTQ